MILEEMMHMEMKFDDPNVNFLMMISVFKDELPWVYEIGLETYRGLKSTRSKVEKRKLLETFERALEMVGHPIFREMYSKSEDMYMFSKEIRHFTLRFLDRYLIDDGSKKENENFL